MGTSSIAWAFCASAIASLIQCSETGVPTASLVSDISSSLRPNCSDRRRSRCRRRRVDGGGGRLRRGHITGKPESGPDRPAIYLAAHLPQFAGGQPVATVKDAVVLIVPHIIGVIAGII